MENKITCNDEGQRQVDGFDIDITSTSTNPVEKTLSPLQIHSLHNYKVHLSPDIQNHLEQQFNKNNNDGPVVVEQILEAMKKPPATTICRINSIKATRQDVIEELKQRLLKISSSWQIQEDPIFFDVVNILPLIDELSNEGQEVNSNVSMPSNQSVPEEDDHTKQLHQTTILFPNWATRKQKGWPMTHRVIICDRFCGEAVLRGSDIFVKGVLVADTGIRSGEVVAVYTDIPASQSTFSFDTVSTTSKKRKVAKTITRGLVLEQYHGTCVYLGLGETACSRKEIFKKEHGIAVHMSLDPKEQVRPVLPPLHGIVKEKMILQNLPSVLVAHALNPLPNDVILDMCAAPGGKTSHLASLVRNQAIIVACDRSRKKIIEANNVFRSMGATCITSLALDSTKCLQEKDDDKWKDVKQIIDEAPVDPTDGLKQVRDFSPESFDRILLDPPCSALGLRPKLFIAQHKLSEIDRHAQYQRKFVDQAVQLLKPGGYMTYSTCTINADENERIVKYILDEYPQMELCQIQMPVPGKTILGMDGLKGYGLNEEQRSHVRRFDPSDLATDTMGFFLALFRKNKQCREKEHYHFTSVSNVISAFIQNPAPPND